MFLFLEHRIVHFRLVYGGSNSPREYSFTHESWWGSSGGGSAGSRARVTVTLYLLTPRTLDDYTSHKKFIEIYTQRRTKLFYKKCVVYQCDTYALWYMLLDQSSYTESTSTRHVPEPARALGTQARTSSNISSSIFTIISDIFC